MKFEENMETRCGLAAKRMVGKSQDGRHRYLINSTQHLGVVNGVQDWPTVYLFDERGRCRFDGKDSDMDLIAA